MTGKLVTGLQFTDLDGGTIPHGLRAVAVGNKWGYIDTLGQLVIQPQFDGAKNFSEELGLVSMDGKYAFVDKTGKFIINPQFESAGNFSEGLAPVQFSDGTHGYVDTTGRAVINLPDGADGGQFLDGFAAVYYSDGTIGYINKTGNVVSRRENKYDALNANPEDGLTCVRFKASQKWGCLDKTGQLIIPAQFDDVSVYQGLANVSIGDKSGWMDETGNYVWRPTK